MAVITLVAPGTHLIDDKITQDLRNVLDLIIGMYRQLATRVCQSLDKEYLAIDRAQKVVLLTFQST